MTGPDRKTILGASDAPAVCGLSPWQTPLGLYLEKTGELPAREPSEAMQIGTELEDAIRRLTEKRLEVIIHKPLGQRHEKIDWMWASPDGLIVNGNSGGGPTEGFEAKNVGPAWATAWGEPGTDEVPEGVILQVQHQMVVWGLEKVVVGALICGNELRTYEVQRNDLLIGRLLNIEALFWERVQKREPPPPDFTHQTTPGLLAAMYPVGEGRVELDEEAEQLAEFYAGSKARAKHDERLADEFKARLLARMGTASLGLLPGGGKISRKHVSRKGYEVAASEYDTFNVRLPKEQHDGSNAEGAGAGANGDHQPRE